VSKPESPTESRAFRCIHCGYSLDGLAGAAAWKCPECGRTTTVTDLCRPHWRELLLGTSGIGVVARVACALLILFPLGFIASIVVQSTVYPTGGGPGRSKYWMIDNGNTTYEFVVGTTPVIGYSIVAVAMLVFAARRFERLGTSVGKSFGAIVVLGLVGAALGYCLYFVAHWFAMMD